MSRISLVSLGLMLSVAACTKTAAGTAPVGSPCTLNGDCQNGLVCMDGKCISVVGGGGGGGSALSCTAGKLRCNGGDVEQCATAGDAWDFKQACQGRCSNGACVAQTCTPSATRCSTDNHSVEACGVDGSGYSVVQTCDLGCANGLCTSSGSPICTAGDKRCNSESLEACTPSGTAWAFLQFCATGCDATTKACKAPACVAFTERCNPVSGAHEICNSAGTQLTAAPCSSSEACLNGKCTATVCTPGQTRCLDTVTQGACNPSGTDFKPTPCPANQVCNGGTCAPIVCSPFSTKCKDAATSQVCAPSGTGYVDVGCPSGSSCSSGNCLPANSNTSCTANAARCVDAITLGTCNAQGSGFNYSTCTAGQVCLGTACTAVICAPGAASCASASSSQLCDPSGTKYNAVACGSSAACDATSGQCKPTVCAASATVCVDAATLGTCNTSLTGYVASACGSGKVCSAGSCQSVICTPSTATCSNATTASICNGVGTATTTIDCAAQSKVCQGGACQTSGTGSIICVPGSFQCSGSDVQQCKPDGTTWTYVQSCTTTCVRGSCASTACAPFNLAVTHSSVPADNNSTTLVVSDVIQDINGVVVPDGTLFTVAAGSNTGGIISADVDSVTPGIQVASVNGQIDFTVKAGPGSTSGQDAGVSATTLISSACKGAANFALVTATTTGTVAEDFTRTTNKDVANSTAAWDTGKGQSIYPLVSGLGNAEDGDLYVQTGQTFDINAASNPAKPSRTFPDATTFGVTSISTNSVVVEAFPSGIVPGDEVILINLRGGGGNPSPTATNADGTGNTGNVGHYELFTVTQVNGATNTVTFGSPITKIYGNTTDNTTLTNQKIVLQRVPHYGNVTVSGTLTASAWDGTKGGLFFVKANGTFVVTTAGTVTMTGMGYRGASPSLAYSGESYSGFAGAGTNLTTSNGGGGTATSWSPGCYYGAGGSYGTRSAAPAVNCAGAQGLAYGDGPLTNWFLGSAGGSWNSGGTLYWPVSAGGILVVWAPIIGVSGSVTSSALSAPNYAGGCSGGTVYLRGNTVNVGSNRVSAAGGASPYASAGGAGRIRIDALAIHSGDTTTPTYVAGGALAGAGAKAQTLTLDNASGTITKARVASAVADSRGGTITYELSANGGTNWNSFIPGDPLVSFSTAASDLRLRVTLIPDGSNKPLGVQGVAIEYLAP